MTDKTVERILAFCLILAGLFLLASCGAEPPWFASVDPEDVGDIIVRSTPEGAAIFLDDEAVILDGGDQQATTPYTLKGLEPGDYKVTVTAEGFVPDPALVTVNLKAAQTDSADFNLTLPAEKTVILEGFSNVSCPPCPELTDNLLAMMAKPEFPADRVLFLEFAVSWPQLADPFFLANAQENADRYGLYGVAAAPDLYVDGIQQVDPLDATEMENAVLADLELDPGFVITVDPDFSSSTVPVTVILTANRNVDLTGHVLYIAIYENEVVIDPAPGVNGQTEFHHIFRDRVDVLPTLGALAPETPQQFHETLTSGSAGPEAYVAVAFVQNATTHAIVQAGSTISAKKTPTAASSDVNASVRSLERKFR